MQAREELLAPAPIALAIAVVIIIVRVGGYFFLQRSVDQQESALLENQTTDAGATASSVFGEVVTASLSSNATLLELTGASPDAFASLNPPSPNNPLSVNPIRKPGDQYVVAVAAGKGFTTGDLLSGPALATVEIATASGVVSGPVTSNGTLSYGRFAIKVSGDLYIYGQLAINPHFTVESAVGPRAFPSAQHGDVRAWSHQSEELALYDDQGSPGTLRLNGSSGEDSVIVVVEDTAGGVDQSVVGHVFEPFFTTRTSGTGLGLSIVPRHVLAHDGNITLENVAGGVRASVVLPAAVHGVPA